MKYRLFMLVVFLALPAVAAGPQTLVTNCDVQIQIRDGRDPEGLPIRGQRADLILPCVTKEELGSIIKDFAKGRHRTEGSRSECSETRRDCQTYAHNRGRDAGEGLTFWDFE